MTLEASNQNNSIAAPYEKPEPKPVPKKKVVVEKPQTATPPPSDEPEQLTVNSSGKLQDIMNICKENKLMSLLVVVTAGTLAYYLIDSYVLKK